MKLTLKNTEIKILYGDVLHSFKVDAVVNPTDTNLKICTHLRKIIKLKNLKIDQQNKILSIEPVSVLITSYEKLKCCKYIIHVVRKDREFKIDQEFIRLTTRNLFNIVETKNIGSIATPILVMPTKKFSFRDILKIMCEEMTKYILEHPETKIKKIFFIPKNKQEYKIFSETIPEHIGYINRKIGVYPIPTVDIIIVLHTKQKNGIVLIERKNPPYGWAIPGGFVEYNESLESAALREAKEETGLTVKNLRQFHTYSQPGRDPRFHTISTVYIADAYKMPKPSSDAKRVVVATKEEILADKYPLVFDHKKILMDYFSLLSDAGAESNYNFK